MPPPHQHRSGTDGALSWTDRTRLLTSQPALVAGGPDKVRPTVRTSATSSPILAEQRDLLDQVLVQDARIRFSAFEGLANHLGQVCFGRIVLESKSEILLARKGGQNLLDAVKATIEVIETVFYFHCREHVGSLNESRDPARAGILASSPGATLMPRLVRIPSKTCYGQTPLLLLTRCADDAERHRRHNVNTSVAPTGRAAWGQSVKNTAIQDLTPGLRLARNSAAVSMRMSF